MKNKHDVIISRFLKGDTIAPLVAQLYPVNENGTQLRHRWRNSIPIFKMGYYCATDGAIISRFLKRDTIAPLVAQLYPVNENGTHLRH